MKIRKTKESSWLIYEKDRGILVDTGLHHCAGGIMKMINAFGIKDVTIFLTHTHYDHAGSAEDIRKATGAKVAVSAIEADNLRKGYTPVPRGTDVVRDLLTKTAHSIQLKSVEHYTPVKENIIEVSGHQELILSGFDIEVIPLGAHTQGSIGMRIGDHLFAGDTLFSVIGDLYPPFADFADKLPTAWETILDSGAENIYPGHGRMVTRERLEDAYQKRFGK